MAAPDVVVVGGGIFGLTGAIALRRRGHAVTLLDPGPLPHPLAASTDISKVLRIEYAADELYTALATASRERWLEWNRDLFGEELYHDVGITMFTREPMEPGGYEYENYHTLLRLGHAPERLDSAAIARRFPAWNAELYVDGYFNPQGGYIESGRVISALAGVASGLGVALCPGTAAESLLIEGERVVGVVTQTGNTIHADHLVVAAGVWTVLLVPGLASMLTPTGHPVFHLRPSDPALFAAPRFVVFSADSSRTGWYGFPLHPRAGVVKIARHGPGLKLHPRDDPRLVTDADTRELRAFCATTFPALVDAPVVFTRRCMYCDTPDEHFLIDRHPTLAGLTVASGDSGHAFKFAPVLGDMIADAVEGSPASTSHRFRWRNFDSAAHGEEPSRWRGDA